MNVFLTARMKTFDEFKELYDKKYLNESDDEKALIFYAAGNTKIQERYRLVNYLIDEGANVHILDKYGDSLLHVLLGHVQHDLPSEVALCRRLIEMGVDINILNNKNVLAIQWLMNMKYSDEKLKPLYDLWFAQDYVDVTTKNAWGYSPLELAEKDPLRTDLVRRMRERL
ncbi:MAG: ankyrin repeat domain-containing protein [Lentihominibacter sp.]|uniref:ankyrin repeat domain-containing protein n=1 Tax=Lentihominibacter sp. TaxID=2944216 RepID=UPI002A91B9D2|nr:ankyrin repeat domain-containing protein [Lentihominibacter sp.]MDY5287693.1 ankyrin repeat domain-containing protein [Lentihominibacter sp.]